LGGVRLVFGTEFRRRWRSWLILVVLVAVVGGLTLAAAAAGRRTATAFPRFVDDHGYDVLIFNITPLPQLTKLPEVASVTIGLVPGNTTATCTTCSHDINSSGYTLETFTPRAMNRAVKLVSGRMPDPSAADELLASYNLEQDYGVHVGTTIRMPFLTAAQEHNLNFNATNLPAAKGPTLTFHVVGIEAAESEFPVGDVPSYDFYGTSALSHQQPTIAYQYYVRLHSAADLPRFSVDLGKLHAFFTQNQDTIATAVAASIHPQAVGWWVLALLAGLAGLVVLGQALGRQSVVESEEYATLAALGLERRRLVTLGTARNLVIALAGALGAILVAFALSPLTPVGEARLAEPSTGLAFDPLVLLLGALAIVVVVLGLGVWPTIRAARVSIGGDRARQAHPSAIVARFAGTGAPPSAVIGVRHALERGRGAATVPVGTALFGTVLAVTALSATVVFGASLTHLTTTPELYGDSYQLLISNEEGTGNVLDQATRLSHDPAVTGIMIGTRSEVSINGTTVFAVIGKAVRGPLLLSKVSGRLPGGEGEIALGSTTMHQVGARMGSEVNVKVQLPLGGTRTEPFRVVGTASFPGQFGLGGLGSGAAFTLGGYLGAACPAGATQAKCTSAFEGGQPFALLAKTVPGPKGEAAVAHYLRAYFADDAKRPRVPTSLVNFGEAVNFPLILGLVLTVFGAATLVHLLVVSVSRRRREIGLLKSLGLVNNQVGAAVCWQATTVAVVGIVVGIPLGIAVGQLVWRAFATNLGAVPESTVPTGLIVALALGVVVVANLLAIVPAVVAARSKTAGELLRTQ
jgi:ABC-type lipoprotein release transport system permease subunit